MSQKPASKRFRYFVTAGLPLIICEVTDYRLHTFVQKHHQTMKLAIQEQKNNDFN